MMLIVGLVLFVCAYMCVHAYKNETKKTYSMSVGRNISNVEGEGGGGKCSKSVATIYQ